MVASVFVHFIACVGYLSGPTWWMNELDNDMKFGFATMLYIA